MGENLTSAHACVYVSLQDEGGRSAQINRRGSFTRASFTRSVPEIKVEDKIGEMVRKVSRPIVVSACHLRAV